MMNMLLLAGGLFCYLVGSIPFGLLLTRLFGLGDIRQIGSGNIGATNVLRTGNKKLALATLLLDGMKGAAALAIADAVVVMFLSSHFSDAEKAEGAMNIVKGLMLPVYDFYWALAALAGHAWPLWLKFKGGKGVATHLGLLTVLAPFGAAFFAAVWLGTFFFTRISSFSALLASLISAMIAWLIVALLWNQHVLQSSFGGHDALVHIMRWGSHLPHLGAIYATLGGLLIFYTHRANIARLRAGTEPRFGKATS